MVRGSSLPRQARAVKALLVAVLSTLVALVSHVLAGGSVPGMPGVLVPLVLSLVVCLPLSGRLLSLPQLVMSVLASQLLFHWLFVLGSTSPGVRVVEDHRAGHGVHHTEMIVALGAGADPGAHASHSEGWMWAGHVIAAIVTILLIRRGEMAVVGLWRLTLILIRSLFGRGPRVQAIRLPSPRSISAHRSGRRRTRWLLAASITERGPPRAIAISLL